MKTLGLISLLTILDGAVSAGVADGTLPSRPVFAGGEGVAPPTRITRVQTTSLPQGTPVAAAEVPKAVRSAVVADAAKRLRVAESAIVLVRAERLMWNDGSLGCVEPGVMYTQNLVPGYLIIAKASDGEYEYHTDARGLQARSCGAGGFLPGRKLPGQAPVRATQRPADR
jgi:hypothetical protein